MKVNKLVVKINKPVNEVFKFTTTPPNSTKWIPGVVSEETNDWPIKVGTIYKLKDESGNYSEVNVLALRIGKFIEWVAKDGNYHCRYNFKKIDENCSVLEYLEWVETGDLPDPFTQEILEKLKTVIENT
ncbi:MAG: hypothetical protein U1C50_01635 [Patescibacteria group bacterium]|nr:hypothetical protein [Candidatus Beckwithbacteria bacterium]MDZ4228936.1 hypothetical protein [Patescibacteria group bacterium]